MTIVSARDAPVPAANFTQSGILGKSLAFYTLSRNNIWIIDTGASDHMIKDSSQLFNLCNSSQSVISTANGGTSKITGQGSLTLSDSLFLDSVLVVPSLEYNLLSDIPTRTTLGYGVRRGQLYFLEVPDHSHSSLATTCATTGPEQSCATIWLWHRRLVVHSDVWGPANVPSFSKAYYYVTFIDESVVSVAYLINRTPSSALHFKTPQQTLESYFSIPHIPNLEPRVFGCMVCYDPVLHKMHVTMDVSFQELEPYYSGRDSVTSSQGEIPTTREEIITLQHTPGPDVTPSTNDFATRLTPITEASSLDVPESIPEDALDDPNWKEAMNVEMKALQKNSTWDLVPLPTGKKPIGCKWVFTVKLKADGSLDRYKARLVAKGYAQKYGVDYQDTFAPVAKLNTICIMISITANRDWPLKQFDVKNAFLNGDLEEEVYMEIPPGTKHANLKGNELLERHLANEFEMKDLGSLKFMHNPSEDHMAAVYRILRYLKGCPGKGNLVTWKSKKQKVVARSSAEAEFRGMAHGVCELLWIKSILQDLGICYNQPMELHCDNKAAIEIAHNPIQHDRTKHVEVDRHFIKEKLDQKIIQFPYIKSEDQLADILTKAVSGKVFEEAINKLGMIDIYAPT
ncbi:uncharacterized protein LOC133293706 [Gastrolobium bilobum]|uniref:uncharacterized protein LOC133293706 n=1 Tax=Gastrolobium bilobum TaxID=150636 RepID=UPI002AB2B9B9|nr:uncharacterized protein LOC133293706 [Gastrolobium bilobum]